MPEKELIVGWRGWTFGIEGDDGYLRSLSYNHFAWPKREAADCNVTPYKESNCRLEHTGGIHAYKQRGEFLAALWQFNVVGEVYLWGQVIEHEHGYRARYAYPKSFQVRPGFDPVKVMQLEEDYGVPVTFAEDLDRPREVPGVSPFMQQLGNPLAQAQSNQLSTATAGSQAQWLGTIPNTVGAASVTSPWYSIIPSPTHHWVQITNGGTTLALKSDLSTTPSLAMSIAGIIPELPIDCKRKK